MPVPLLQIATHVQYATFQAGMAGGDFPVGMASRWIYNVQEMIKIHR